MMSSKVTLVALSLALAACSNSMAAGPDVAAAGVASVNVPVVSRTDYLFDASAPGGVLPPREEGRLDGWFQLLDIRYGDTIYVDGSSSSARDQVAAIASRRGLVVSPGVPATAAPQTPDSVRVIVSRAEAYVPNCPNWSVPSQPNFSNANNSNFGCGVNTNVAAMMANPEDLIEGRSAAAASDPRTATKPVTNYRNAPPTGNNGLAQVSTTKND